MADYIYHVECSPLTSTIYAGVVNKKGDKWLHKSAVTGEAIEAVRDYLLQTMGDGQKMTGYQWERKDGKIVELMVKINDKKSV